MGMVTINNAVLSWAHTLPPSRAVIRDTPIALPTVLYH